MIFYRLKRDSQNIQNLHLIAKRDIEHFTRVICHLSEYSFQSFLTGEIIDLAFANSYKSYSEIDVAAFSEHETCRERLVRLLDSRNQVEYKYEGDEKCILLGDSYPSTGIFRGRLFYSERLDSDVPEADSFKLSPAMSWSLTNSRERSPVPIHLHVLKSSAEKLGRII